MYTVGIIREDVSDILSENNTDARIVISLYELDKMVTNVCVTGREELWRTLIAVCEGGARVAHSWAHAPSRIRTALFSATCSIALSKG